MIGQGVGQTRFAHPPGAEHPADDDPGRLPVLGHPPLDIRQDPPLEHVGHLIGHAGNGVDHLVTHRADQPGGGALGLRDESAPSGTSAWRRFEGDISRWRELNIARISSTTLLVPVQPDVHDLGDGLPGDVVLGGPEPAADDDAVAAGQRGAEGEHHPVVVVPDRLVEMGADAGGGQVLTQPRRVGVGDLAQQQLGPHRHDLNPHGWISPRPSDPSDGCGRVAPSCGRRGSTGRR